MSTGPVINLDELRSYIPWALQREGWRFSAAGTIIPNAHNLPPGYFPTFLYESYKADVREANRFRRRNPLRTTSYSDFRRVYDMVQDEQTHGIRAKSVGIVRFSGTENLQPLRDFCQAVTLTADETTVNVFAHFISNIKRKMLGLPVTYQLMPILTGKQKGGKSTAVRKLLSPLGETVHETALTTALRAESFTLFSQFFVVFFDEMEGIQKTSISALKKMVTEERAGGRLYYTQKNVNLPNLCSFIGTANDSAVELIDDKTGARRFYETRCAEKLDWEKLNSLDYTALWQGIDENSKSGYYLASEKEIDTRQLEMVSMDLFQMFINENHLRPDESSEAAGEVWLTTATFYKIYTTWLESYKVGPLHAATFFKKLTANGFRKQVRTIVSQNGQRTTLTAYAVSKRSALAVEAADSEGRLKLLLGKEKGAEGGKL